MCAADGRGRYRFPLFTGGRDQEGAEPAKIRAFFIDPRHARRGIGRAILERSEAEAIRAGFSALELMATLPGRRLYERCGYVAQDAVQIPLQGDLQITFVPMRKDLGGNTKMGGQPR